MRGSTREEDLLLASQAERGMRIISRDRVVLNDPNRDVDTIRGIYRKCQAIYGQAFAWDPPLEYSLNRTWHLREHIKRLINGWDLRRLYPNYDPDIRITELREEYREDPELQTPTEGENGEAV